MLSSPDARDGSTATAQSHLRFEAGKEPGSASIQACISVISALMNSVACPTSTIPSPAGPKSPCPSTLLSIHLLPSLPAALAPAPTIGPSKTPCEVRIDASEWERVKVVPILQGCFGILATNDGGPPLRIPLTSNTLASVLVPTCPMLCCVANLTECPPSPLRHLSAA